MRQPSFIAVSDFLRNHRKGQRILVAASTDSSALGVLDAARQSGREQDFAIAGQDCIPEVLDELRKGTERDDRFDLARRGNLRSAADSAGNRAAPRPHRSAL